VPSPPSMACCAASPLSGGTIGLKYETPRTKRGPEQDDDLQ
jgi:hypothetical protein